LVCLKVENLTFSLSEGTILTEVVLGTANFGNNYGVLNSKNGGGETVTTQEAINIIKYCKSVGIKKFDTASTYGSAMLILEEYLKNDAEIEVLNKISWVGGSSLHFTKYHKELIELMQRPIGGITTLVQWHNWEGNQSDLERMEEFQAKFKTSHNLRFGVTTYGVKNAELAANLPFIDSVQFEYNVLNQLVIQALSSNNSHRACNYVIRSILLQGLLPSDNFGSFQLSPKLLDAITHFQTISNIWGLPPLEVAIRSMLNYPINSDLIIGATSIQELNQVLVSLLKGPLPGELFEQLLQLRKYDVTLADPRNWNNS
jgi:aryl-alcohol dehydrogenase-like predicted oxidoreductase